MKIFETRQTKIIDQYTIEHEPVSSLDLMERASFSFVREFVSTFPLHPQLKVVVVAGHGNNGGDALAIARLLSSCDYCIEVFLYNPRNKLSNDCLANLERLRPNTSVRLTEDSDFSNFPVLTKDCVVIDGLFGSGLNAPLSEDYARLITHINASQVPVVAIDIPSGLFGENNFNNRKDAILRACLCLSFQYPKLSFLFPENKPYVGKWKVLDISLHPDALANTNTPYSLLTHQTISRLIKKRGQFDHKGVYGHALLIAGSMGKTGAAVLASKACLRAGVGLLTCLIPKEGMSVIQTAVPEAMACIQLPSSEFSAIGIGPGMGTDKEAKEKLTAVLLAHRKPMVIDADALNMLAIEPQLMDAVPKESILTPHPKEFDRIAGSSTSSFERLQKARDLAVRRQVYIVLKGAYTAICTPEDQCFFNSTGNPGMATAGSGDVLTGIILSLLAQGYSSEQAALIGVYIHGLAADMILASGIQSEESLNAGDIPEMLGACFNRLRGM